MPKPLRENDNYGIGQMEDGSINVIPPDEVAERAAQRDADQAAFEAMLDDDGETE